MLVGVAGEALAFAAHRHEGLLGGILSRLGIAKQGMGHAQQVALVAGDQFRCSLHIMPPGEPAQQLGIRRGLGDYC
jgi:hypothetical protein